MKRKRREIATRARAWLRGNDFAYLVLHFFKRFFSGETLSAESDLRLGIGGVLALLALPGAFLSLLLLHKYSSFLRWLQGERHFDYNTASIPDKYMLLTLTMAITGIVAVLKWEGVFPDPVDYANLAALPVEPRRIFLAKFVALILFVGLFVLALNVVSTILFPLVVMGDQSDIGLWSRLVAAHAVAAFAGSYFMFFFFSAGVGLLITLLPYRRFRQISTGAQWASVLALVTLLFVTPEIGSLVTDPSWRTGTVLGWLPTVWFLGLYQEIFGQADAGFHVLAMRAVEGLTAVVAAALVFYAASFSRYFLHIPEMMESAASGPRRLQRFATRCFDRFAHLDAFERSCFHFVTKTLVRSQRHRLLLAGFFGLGMAIAIQDVATAWRGTTSAALRLPNATLLSAPLAITFFLLTGLRFVFNVPAELRANWIFRVICEDRGNQACRVAKELMLMFLTPIIILTSVTYSVIWGAWFGVAHASFVLLVSLLLTDALLLGYRKIPCTCSYALGKHNAGIVLTLYFLLFLLFSSGLADLEYWALSSPSTIPFVMLIGILVVGWAWLHRYRGELAGEAHQLIFEEGPEPVVLAMDLR